MFPNQNAERFYIEGWLHETTSIFIDSILKAQKIQMIQGDSLEIGVYMGKTLAKFVVDRNENEKTFGIDTFNVIYPQEGISKDILPEAENNIKSLNRYFEIKGETILIRGNSQDQSVISKIKDRCFRVVSIDGSHALEECLQDLLTYSKYISNNGAMIVDDFCNPMNPEVTIALSNFLQSDSGKDWGIVCGLTPSCATPLEASTRILLSRKSFSNMYRQSLDDLMNPFLVEHGYLPVHTPFLNDAFQLLVPPRIS